VRRVEATTGLNALRYVQGMEATLGGVAGTLKVAPGEVPARVGALLEQMRELEKEMNALKSRLASAQGDELVNQAVDVNGVKVLAAVLSGADAKALRETMDKLKDKLKTAAIVLAAVDGGKVQLAAGVTGKADMAMAGGTDASGLPKALASVRGWVAQRV
jgi:alanyl-tRNA synthetase